MQDSASIFGMTQCVSWSGPKKQQVMFRNPTSNLSFDLPLMRKKAPMPAAFLSCTHGQRRACDA